MKKTIKPTLVLIPGLGNNARIWAAQIEELSSDYELIVPDYSSAMSIEEMADGVLAEVCVERFSLVGFSLGGYIALNLIQRIPQRIERLAIISSSPYADSDQAAKQREKLIDAANKDYGAVLKNMAKAIVCSDGPNAETAREVLCLMGQEIDVDVFCRHQRAATQRADTRAVLASINCPVRVLVGAQDVVTPVSGNRFFAENISGASLQVIQDSGHLLPLERPNEVNTFLRQWLEFNES